MLVYLPKLTDCRFGVRERAATHGQAGVKRATGLIQSCKSVLELLQLVLHLKSSD